MLPSKLTVIFSMTVIVLLLVMLGESRYRTARSVATNQHANTFASRQYAFTVIRTWPHDSTAFTQGLAYHDGFLYESTGLHKRSSLRKIRLDDGTVVKQVNLPNDTFGEGLAIIKDSILQLTWKSGRGFIYDLSSFRLLGHFTYSSEGWGLTTNSEELFLSDGTDQIRILSFPGFREKRRISVHDGTVTISQLNELEFVDGEIFANIWHDDRIARISPQDGSVLGWIDLAGLLSPRERRDQDAVLNGIAYDSAQKRLFVTGKLWPYIFQISIFPEQ